jgi:AraC family transcriptional regulator, transcriptional activator FtrA
MNHLRPRCCPPCVLHTVAALELCPFAPVLSCSRRRVCLTEGGLRHTGGMWIASRKSIPKSALEPDVLYVDEGRLLTSAGSAAGIDLCLHIIRRDFGARIANHVAKGLVVAAHRDGDQAQYVPAVIPAGNAQGLASLLEWARCRLKDDLSIAALAKRAGMSTRSFARHFLAEVGTTPKHWLNSQRLFAAQQWLETTREPIDRIAEEVGMRTAATLRHHFRNAFHTSPATYRRRFTVVSTTRSPNGR